MKKRAFFSLFFCAGAFVLAMPMAGWAQAQETLFYFFLFYKYKNKLGTQTCYV